MDINARVIQLAKEQHRVNQRNVQLKAMREELFAMWIRELDDEIEANTAAVNDMEAKLREDVLAYMQETGDLHVHPALTFRRTKKLYYDKDEVLASLKREGVTDFTRVKEELKVREFEKAWNDGELQWVNVEAVNTPTLAISKLGDLVIALEAGLLGAE